MDSFKPLLEIKGKTLVENAINLFKDTGVKEIVTVIGYRSEALIPIIEKTASRSVVNENYQYGMLSSIQKGVAELKDICDAFFLLPVDIPCVRTSTVKQLLEKYHGNPSALICYPESDSRRGHPPLIASSLIDRLVAYSGEEGMRGFLKGYENRAVTVPVADPFIHLDVDTEEDLSQLQKEIAKFS